MAASLPKGPEGRARAFVLALSKADWAHDGVVFDDAMKAAMPAAKLHDLWDTLQAAGGPFQAIDGVTVQEKDGIHVVLVTAKFERLRKVIRIALDKDDHVMGLFYGPVSADLEAKARRLLEALTRADFAAAARDFAPSVSEALPPAKLAATWAAIEAKAGKWQKIDAFELAQASTVWTARAASTFANAKLVVEIVFDARDQIAGFFVKAPAVAWAPPSYADAEKYQEREVTVGASPALPGTLTLPKGAGPFPVVVLVHGSGPNDRDESVGAIKPFKDLAWGLASKGIAVLRYEKRTRVSPVGVVTQKEEVEDGARDAIALLKSTPEIDGKRIFLLGHSQGGYLAPRIARANPGLAGVIVLAGSTRPLEDSILAQFRYFRAQNPSERSLDAMIDAAVAFKQKVEDPKLVPTEDVHLPTGGTAKGAYFLDVRGYDPPAVADKLTMRILCLQGERDYQVTIKEDFAGWKKKLGGKKTVTFHTYPTLNHLFASGQGDPNPSEYETPGHVDEAVVRDIAQWIQTP